jgi:hypothetical protein
LIRVDLQEHVPDAQGRALVMGDDDLDLSHAGDYCGLAQTSTRFIGWRQSAYDTMHNWATSRSTTLGGPDAAEVTSYP